MNEYWRRFCDLQRYAFFLGDECVLKTPFDTGNHIDVHEASELVDEMCEEINALRRQLAEKNTGINHFGYTVRRKLLKLDTPTETTGVAYTKDSVEACLRQRPGETFYGEISQPLTSEANRVEWVDVERVAVKVENLAIEDGWLGDDVWLTGDVSLAGPRAKETDSPEDVKLAARLVGTVNYVDGVKTMGVQRFIAFDVQQQSSSD